MTRLPRGVPEGNDADNHNDRAEENEGRRALAEFFNSLRDAAIDQKEVDESAKRCDA